MRRTQPFLILSVVAAILFTAAFACNSDSGSSTSNGSSNSSSNSTTSTNSSSHNIAGDYKADGTNPNGQKYSADLKVTPHDDVYQFTWVSGKSSYDGVGVMTDNEVAVSFAGDGGSGKGCGVVLYKIASPGNMEGKIGYWGTNTMETETAVRKTGNGNDLDGVYNVSGKNPQGKDYTGTLTIIQSGEGYTFDWDAGAQISGFGVRADQYVAVGFGGKQCAFVGYDIKSNGNLEGKWGSQFGRKFGSETATKK
ncbi:MAG: hypothetical protein JO053_07860 [Acidobacteria bacterium]|nr:hypothetical protein [Acidobacteriota bacterium]